MFRDPSFLERALTHASSKADGRPSNERLEFLGDSVLGAVVARDLYERFPAWNEGELTRVKSAVVSSATLGAAAARLGLVEVATLGKGLRNVATYPVSLLANLFEATVAAVFLDGGLDAAARFVRANLGEAVDAAVRDDAAKTWKSLLQHYASRALNVVPSYRLVREEGPDHGKLFEVVARLGEREYRSGSGRTKKEAEQRAARATFEELTAAPDGSGVAAPENAGAAGPGSAGVAAPEGPGAAGFPLA